MFITNTTANNKLQQKQQDLRARSTLRVRVLYERASTCTQGHALNSSNWLLLLLGSVLRVRIFKYELVHHARYDWLASS